MELSQLRAFLAAAQYENMTRAAESLHVTQPALSRTIARLEQELGVQLFDRAGRSVQLNEFGRAAREHAEAALAELGAMERHLQDLSGGLGGTIRVASSFPTREPDFLYEAVRDFAFRYPDVRLRVRQMEPQQIGPALLAREVDLALTGPSVQSEEIAWQRLCTEPMGIILSRGHPLAALGELSVAQLRGQRFYCNNSNSDSYDLTRYFCAQAGFEPDVCYEGDFPQFIGEAISRGLGVSFIAPGRFAGGAEQAWETDIVFRPLTDAFCVRESGIAAARGCYRTKAVRAFCDCLSAFAGAPLDFSGGRDSIAERPRYGGK